MRHALAKRARLDQGYVIVRFILYGGVAAPLCSALLAASALALIGGLGFATTLLHWYLADALGLLTLGALLLSVEETDVRPTRGAWVASWSGVIQSSAAATIAFTRGWEFLLFAVPPILTIATLRAP